MQEIYRIENRLFMIMETVEGFDPAAKAAADAVSVLHAPLSRRHAALLLRAMPPP